MNSKPIILIADHAPESAARIDAILRERYQVRWAASGRDALYMAVQMPRPDLILLELAMPDIDGDALCRQIKADSASAAVPVLLLAPREMAGVHGGLCVGAADRIDTPVDPVLLLARVATHLQLKAVCAMLEERASHLEYLVAERTREAVQMQDETILAMASLAETRDNDSGNHIRRTQRYVAALARALQSHPRFCAELTDANIAMMYKAAPLHDIGKVGVPDAILLKPARLTDEEFEIMKRHTVYGRDTIMGVEKRIGSTHTFLRYASEIAYSHQEKYDGSGYPEALSGDAIPLSARLMTVADVYDAMVSKRIHKPSFTHETALELIRQGRGTHFDPDVVDAMLMIEDQFVAIAAEFLDPA